MRRALQILFINLFVLAACEDVVEVDVPQSEAEVVISGWITDSLPPEVTVSTTDDFFGEGQTPRISGATVRLFENGVEKEVLAEVDTTPGLYRGTYLGSVGNEYWIEVIVPPGFPGKVSGNWLSIPERMNRVPEIDSLKIKYLTKTTTPAVFTGGNYILGYFQEPPGEGDFFPDNLILVIGLNPLPG